MIKNLLSFLAFAISLSVNAQSKTDKIFKDAPVSVNQFMENFPDVRTITYSELDNGNFLVGFSNSQDLEMVCKIDTEGKLIQKEMEISASDLPLEICHKCNGQGKLKYIWQIEKDNGEILYLIELKKKLRFYNQIYTSKGDLIPTEEFYASLSE